MITRAKKLARHRELLNLVVAKQPDLNLDEVWRLRQARPATRKSPREKMGQTAPVSQGDHRDSSATTAILDPELAAITS